MKATGIVRRIDDLGRVVIPKEIRRTMRIREGDPLEIYTDSEGEVIFKKYSPLGELGNFSGHYAEALYRTTGKSVCITDGDMVIAASGVPKKDFIEQKITEDVIAFMTDREEYILKHPDDKKYCLLQNNDGYIIGLCIPIIAEGDILGSVVFFCENPLEIPTETDYKLAKTAAIFLGRQMEG